MILLEKDETITFTVRKHWFVFFVDIISISAFLLLPILVAIAFRYLNYFVTIPGNTVALASVIIALLLLYIWTAAFLIWTDYYLDILILTNKHIIDVDQRGLFSREISTFRLDKIQDVTAEADGIIPTLLKFGTIHIQTAGEDREFLVHGIPKPFDIRHTISKNQTRAMEKLRTVNISEESLKKIQ